MNTEQAIVVIDIETTGKDRATDQIVDFCLQNSGFLRWILGKDFPPHVKDVCHVALHKQDAELVAELARRYPKPTHGGQP